MITDAAPALVEIVVSDMARALAFYRLLGLPVPAEADTEPHVDVELSSGMRLAFDTEATIASFHPAWKPGTGGRVGLAFALPDPAAVDAAYAELTGAGHHGELEPFDAFWGMRYATVHDPDGTGIDLFAMLPGGAAGG
jgi:catechol 2,3-dioxygenase-like lactoylglutathione lyase family enzyme